MLRHLDLDALAARSFTDYLEAETLIDPPGPIVARRDGNVDALVWRPRKHFFEQSINQPRPPVGGCDPHLNDIHGINGVDAGEHPDAVIVGVDRNPRGARRVAESTCRLLHPELISTRLSGSQRRTEGGRRVGQRPQPCLAEQGLITCLQTANGGNHGLTLATNRPKLPATYRSPCADSAPVRSADSRVRERAFCASEGATIRRSVRRSGVGAQTIGYS
jgi:hypothetical protein